MGFARMADEPKFLDRFRGEAERLIEKGAVQEPLFSNGTYQFEVKEGKKKEYPLLQVQDDGTLTDSFCSCDSSDQGCVHVAASYLTIFDHKSMPLHIRYQHSFWNGLCQIEAREHGFSTQCLKRGKEGRFFTKDQSFSIEAKDAKIRKRLDALVTKRPVETEETSIKFSNLSVDEILAYREGNGSFSLLYELSFWSDLAKWMLFLEKDPYEIHFSGAPVPNKITIESAGLKIECAIQAKFLPELIPTLKTVHSPLQVYDQDDTSIENVTFDLAKKQLHIVKKGDVQESRGVQIGEWMYVEKKGFYRRFADGLTLKNCLEEGEIGEALSQYGRLLQKFLPIALDPSQVQYQLSIDAKSRLHIEQYVHKIGDIAASFFPWVYVKEKGFYRLDVPLFPKAHTVIEKPQVSDFINQHKLWLHQFPGFQTHLGSLESHLTYTVTEREELIFSAELNAAEEYTEAHHFDEWVYLRGQGFYMKKEGRGRFPIAPGQKVEKEEIGQFIHDHKDELEQVQDFFNPNPDIEKSGLYIELNEQGLVALTPKQGATDFKRFGNYIYIPNKGFTEIPPSARLPERYLTPTVIPKVQETAFFAYELEPLKPYILQIDPRLVKPENLTLKIRKIAPSRKRKGKEWLIDLAYFSEQGAVDIFAIWEAFQEKKRYLFSSAGLLELKESRFNWIRQLHKKRLDRKAHVLRLNTLEWIRLSVFESVEEPQDPAARKILEELNRFETDRLLDLSRLKATLRPYQEEGVKWLWFLYCHGLSGLLCDDMGLGKTHQTMALLAAVVNEDEEKSNKYLVVCPTSVIYHWQELLKKFLPSLRICTYYGLERSLEDFETHYDVILTSYGILRTNRNVLKSHSFEVAIFDEIQIGKNYASQTHKALRSINAKMRLGLTGTPIENRLRELKSLLDIVLPAYLPADSIFRDLFIVPIEKENDASKKALLGKLIKPFILRRKKSEVLTDLPEKIEEIAYTDLSDKQKELYREVALQMKRGVYQELQDPSKPIPFLHVFSALSSLKQICDHPALFLDDIKHFSTYPSGKWDLFIELLHEAQDSGQKVVIFSQYLGMLEMIESYLKKKNIGFASIKGSTRDRPEQLRKFRDDPECTVFVASLLAAGVGIDLTTASIVIHYDRWWNPAKENQATDRVHRIGQNRGVQVFKLVTKHTIEEEIHTLIERKKALLEDIIGNEDQINYLSREELIQVFQKMFTELDS